MSRNPRHRKRVRGTAGALGAAATVSVLFAAPALGATAFTLRGTDILSPGDRPEDLVPALFADDDVRPVDYPASIIGMDKGTAEALDNLAAAMNGVDGPIVIGGFSQGAIAVALEKQRIMALPPEQRPAADQLTFVTIGDPTNPQGILHWLPGRVPVVGVSPVDVPDTPYDTVIVNREYDGWADFPDRPWNVVSTANAVMGIVYVHGRYLELGPIDLDAVPAENVTETTNSAGGKTTTYLVPTDKLPLVQPLRDLGVPEPIVEALERPLKEIVDAGYARNDDQADDAAEPATEAPEPSAAAKAADEPKAGDDSERKADGDAAAKVGDAEAGDAAKPKPRHRADRERPAFKAANEGKPRHRATSPQSDAAPSDNAPEGDDESDSEAA
jgi:PE-PPE domain